MHCSRNGEVMTSGSPSFNTWALVTRAGLGGCAVVCDLPAWLLLTSAARLVSSRTIKCLRSRGTVLASL